MSSYLYLDHEAGAMGLDEGSLQSSLQESAAKYSAWELRLKWNLFSRVEYIVESSWISPARFLLWKLLVWSWTVAIYAMTLSRTSAPTLRFFVFLTNWNQTVLLIYLSCSLYICARHWWSSTPRTASNADHLADIYIVDQSHRDAPLSGYTPPVSLLRFTYAIMEHSFAWTSLVVLIYWTTEFPHAWRENHPGAYDLFSGVCVHGVTLLIIATDLMLNRIEFVFSHLFYTMPISLIYVIVNGVYCKIAGGHIYEVLQWNNAHGVVTSVALVGATCLLFVLYPFGHWVCLQRNKWSNNRTPVRPSKWCSCR